MGLVSWVIVGLLFGAIASLSLRPPRGWLANLVAGVVGAIVGGGIGRVAGFHGVIHSFNVRSFLIAVVCSAVLLVLIRIFWFGRKSAARETTR